MGVNIFEGGFPRRVMRLHLDEVDLQTESADPGAGEVERVWARERLETKDRLEKLSSRARMRDCEGYVV